MSAQVMECLKNHPKFTFPPKSRITGQTPWTNEFSECLIIKIFLTMKSCDILKEKFLPKNTFLVRTVIIAFALVSFKIIWKTQRAKFTQFYTIRYHFLEIFVLFSNHFLDIKKSFNFLLSLTLVLFSSFLSRVTILDGNYYGVTVYTRSRECAMLGGLCVHESDCEKDQLTQKKGLCEDHDISVECCYKVIPRLAPCHQFGGVCTEKCNTVLRQPLGNDCQDDKTCCLSIF